MSEYDPFTLTPEDWAQMDLAAAQTRLAYTLGLLGALHQECRNLRIAMFRTEDEDEREGYAWMLRELRKEATDLHRIESGIQSWLKVETSS